MNTHPFPLRLPRPLWDRLLKITGGYSMNTVIGAALFHWLLLDPESRRNIISDFMSTRETK